MLNAYDALCILPVSLKEEEHEQVLDRAKTEIERLGGSVDSMNILGKRTFARPLKKQDVGVYARMFFQLDAENVDPLLARFKLNDGLFRVQIRRAVAPKQEEPAAAEQAEASGEAQEEENDGGS